MTKQILLPAASDAARAQAFAGADLISSARLAGDRLDIEIRTRAGDLVTSVLIVLAAPQRVAEGASERDPIAQPIYPC